MSDHSTESVTLLPRKDTESKSDPVAAQPKARPLTEQGPSGVADPETTTAFQGFLTSIALGLILWTLLVAGWFLFFR